MSDDKQDSKLPEGSVSASQMAMPFLIINMGGEMLYILEQRLQAQSIVEEKSLRVLQDVISTMFSEKFIGELFKPQRIYSNQSTRQIFDRLAHSSIMRLNESSMDKLYDLMTMGCKYQVLSCSHGSDLLQISLNHLDALRRLVKSTDVVKLVDNAANKMMAMFRDLKPGEYSLLRQTLCRFFQDRRVKVSLFLQDQIQNPDGSIVISHEGSLPRGAETPGTIRYFTEGKLSSEENVKLDNAESVTPATPNDVDITAINRPCKLGLNLYSKDRRKTKKAPKKKGGKSKPSPPQASFEPDETARKAAKAELNLLAQMIGSSQPAQNANAEKFNIINLFPDTSLQGDQKGGEKQAEVVIFDAEDYKTRADQLAQGLGDMDLEGGGEGSDDLLSLMDGSTPAAS